MSNGDRDHPELTPPPDSAPSRAPRDGGTPLPVPSGPNTPAAPGEARTGSLRERLGQARNLIEHVEAAVPAPYRVAVFTELFRGEPAPTLRAGASFPADEAPVAWAGVDLGPYVSALEGPGRLLAKALTTLAVVRDQLEVEWMTPAEIERFLVERARAPHVYRTNLSNALRGARGLVDRRRRGRAYEYRLTEAGDAQVRREAALRPPAANP